MAFRQRQANAGDGFLNSYNPRDGIVIIQRPPTSQTVLDASQNEGFSALQDVGPKVSEWSDLAFMAWRLVHSDLYKPYRLDDTQHPPDYRQAPLYFVYQSISNTDTLRVVATCLEARGHSMHDVPSYPGEKYPIGHWCFKARLQTSESFGIAWLLAQQKETWGLKTLVSVTIFKGEDQSNPSLVWMVGDATAKVVVEAQYCYHKSLIAD